MSSTPSAENTRDRQRVLDVLAADIRQCPLCRLCETRTNAVPGDGPANAKVLLIGEGPGFNEDRKGLPFVGAAGQFLNELLAQANLRRDEVFVTNVVKCRPPNNRDPESDEIAACARYLDQQIAAIKPLVIVTLGRHSMQRFFPGATISRIHGTAKVVDGVSCFAMYHPAAALHQQKLRDTLLEDMRKLPAIIAEAEARMASDTGSDMAGSTQAPAPNPPEQLSLF